MDGLRRRIPRTCSSRDELLDNVMLYWLPRHGASSARLYWESFSKVSRDPREDPDRLQHLPEGDLPSLAPLGREALREAGDWNELDKGGHFAAFEQPATFVNEVRTCFRHMR